MEELESSVAKLAEVGFPAAKCREALLAVPGQSLDLAAERLLAEATHRESSMQSTGSSSRSSAQVMEEPADLLCPVLHTIFRDPVFNAAGNTYDRAAMEQFKSALGGRCLDPLTNERLPDDSLTTNWDMRRRIQAFLDAHPSYTPEGWPDRTMPPPKPMLRTVSSTQPPGYAAPALCVLLLATIVGAAARLTGRSILLPLQTPTVLGLACAGLVATAAAGILASLGWHMQAGIRQLVMSIIGGCGLTMTILAATDVAFPGLALSPLVLAGAAHAIVSSGLWMAEWQKADMPKQAAVIWMCYKSLVYPVLGSVEWMHPGLFLNAVNVACVEVCIVCFVAIHWLA